MDLTSLLMIGLAARAFIAGWLRDDGPFAPLVDEIDMWGRYPIVEVTNGHEPVEPTAAEHARALVAKLLTCSFCLAFHVPMIFVILWQLAPHLGTIPTYLVKVPIWALAATTIVHTMQGVLGALAKDSENG